MITPLGEGSSGEIWRADDLILHTTVALKVLRSTNDADRERILREARLARQITHPAICRVFDIGEAEGCAFYSMELVDGDDVATLLRRAGRFTPEKVLDIGRQLCAGLAAAHAQGVLHRDLKPEDVLIDARGHVRITDFGVAAEPELARTPAAHPYLSPEQRRGEAATERSDVYAIGLILYELLAGQRPPAGERADAAPPRPSQLVDDVDRRLERVIMRAISRDPRRRPPSPEAMARLLDGTGPVLTTPRVWLIGGAFAVVITALAVLASWWLSRPAAAVLTDDDTIVVADFLNSTGEPVFDGALKVALAVGLEQSPFLRVYPDERVRETLRLMARPAEERVTRLIAREIAQRDRLKAVVAGSIAKLGSQYVIALEAVRADNGDVVARQQVEAANKEDVLSALGSAVSRLRQTMGESISSVERFDVPLARATTGSLEALHAYSLAVDQGQLTRPDAVPHLLRAIELDPNFAMAQAALSGVYWNTNRSTDAPVYSRRAYELRDRVSERERFVISWRYYVDAAQAWDQAFELAQSWTTTYPRDAYAFNSLGLASGTFGRHERAMAAFREAMRIDGRFVPPYPNLAGSFVALNRFDDVAGVVSDARARGIETPSLARAAYNAALVRNDNAAFTRVLDEARSSSTGIRTIEWEAQTASFFGRFHAAQDLFDRGVQTLLRDDRSELAAQWTVQAAELHALAGRCDAAGRTAASGTRLSRDSFTLQRAARVAALCGQSTDVAALSAELTKRFPQATFVTHLQLPIASAALALQQGQPARALMLLEAAEPYDHATYAEFWPEYLRGLAYLRQNDAIRAAVQFQGILDRRGEAVTSPLYALAQLGRARADLKAGDTSAARRGYQAFFALWHEADADLPAVSDARRENERLR
jgi:Tfp pilus assembly protein PilF